MNPVFAWAIARLAEPSTWAGLGLIASGITNAVTTHDWPSLAQTVGGVIATVASEGTGKTTPPK